MVRLICVLLSLVIFSPLQAQESSASEDQLPSSDQVMAVVLAAGPSQIKGKSKLLAPLHGKPILQHALESLAQSHADRKLVVVPSVDSEVAQLASNLNLQLFIAPNAEALGRGGVVSLVAQEALKDPSISHLAIAFGDMPFVKGEDYDQAIDIAKKSGAEMTRFVQVRIHETGTDKKHLETIPGRPVVLSRAILPEVTRLQGTQKLMYNTRVLEGNQIFIPLFEKKSRVTFSVETLEDLEDAEEWIKEELDRLEESGDSSIKEELDQLKEAA